LKSRWGGSLEIHDFETLILEINCLPTVQYLHRTVRGYLEIDVAKSMFSNAITSLDFDPQLSIAMSGVNVIKRGVFPGPKMLRQL
jgi:hypothetical protein